VTFRRRPLTHSIRERRRRRHYCRILVARLTVLPLSRERRVSNLGPAELNVGATSVAARRLQRPLEPVPA